MTARRLSQAISEGDGISVLVEVRGAEEARQAASQGAEGIVLRGRAEDLVVGSGLPVLVYGPTLEDAAGSGADAVVIGVSDEDTDLAQIAAQALALGLECVLKVRDEQELERALEHLDPEIFLLTAEDAGDEEPLELLLELLQDVPAGKLAIAELADASRGKIEALERAGIDAVVVRAGNVDHLVGDAPPEV